MELGPASRNIAVETELVEWRRKATDLLLLVGTLVYLPGMTLMLVLHQPPMAWPLKSLALAMYLVSVAGALLRRVSHRPRVWALLGTGYLLSLLASIAVPQGPFMRSLPIYLSMLALVLIGGRAGRVATVISVFVLLFAPFLRVVPGLAESLVDGPVPPPSPTGLLLTQGFALVAALVGLMFLLDRFHLYLLQSLAAERQAVAGMEREVAERAAAHQSLEREMLERRRLESELTRIADEERRRLGQDVHDGLCQQLTGALLRCQALQRRLERGGALEPADTIALTGLLEEAIDEAYAVARGLNPLEPEPGALVKALKSLTRRTQKAEATQCEFITTDGVRVEDPAAAHHLYRIAQEALSNARRHANASKIIVELRGAPDALVLRVQDDGAGVPPEIPPGGMGLRTMAYRARAMEGEFRVERAPEGGTCIICRVPRGSHTRTDGTRATRMGETSETKGITNDGS